MKKILLQKRRMYIHADTTITITKVADSKSIIAKMVILKDSFGAQNEEITTKTKVNLTKDDAEMLVRILNQFIVESDSTNKI